MPSTILPSSPYNYPKIKHYSVIYLWKFQTLLQPQRRLFYWSKFTINVFELEPGLKFCTAWMTWLCCTRRMTSHTTLQFEHWFLLQDIAVTFTSRRFLLTEDNLGWSHSQTLAGSVTILRTPRLTSPFTHCYLLNGWRSAAQNATAQQITIMGDKRQIIVLIVSTKPMFHLHFLWWVPVNNLQQYMQNTTKSRSSECDAKRKFLIGLNRSINQERGKNMWTYLHRGTVTEDRGAQIHQPVNKTFFGDIT